MPERTYSEKEIAEIMRRAAELESDQLDKINASKNQPGLNLQELLEVAAEAGIDPENVRQAARFMDLPKETRTAKINKNEIYAEKWVIGELTEELADLVIADLNHRYNATHERQSWRDNILDDGPDESLGRSKVQRTGKSVEWKYLDEQKTMEVRALIQPVKGKVRIRISKKNVYGTAIEEMDGGAIGYISYIPYLAALVVLFSLPYSFLVNLIAAILAFTLLQFTLVPGAKKLSDRIKDPSNREKLSDRYKREVEQAANEVAELIGDSSERHGKSGRIEIPDPESREQDSGGREQGSRNREQDSGSK